MVYGVSGAFWPVPAVRVISWLAEVVLQVVRKGSKSRRQVAGLSMVSSRQCSDEPVLPCSVRVAVTFTV